MQWLHYRRCPPNIPISEKDILKDMDRRRPGNTKFVSQRKESDKVEILSGYSMENNCNSISMLIRNEDKRSRDYESIKNKFRLSMQILPILKNMELEIIEVVVDNLQEKQHQG